MAETVAARKGCGCRERAARLCRIWQIITREPKTPEGDPCVRFPGHLIRKPDPCIYSQFLLMQLGQPVTWDNPDVRILLGGIEQNTYGLTADTDYVVEVTVRNSSRDKPANGTSVALRWIEFGAGGQTRHPIASLTANVPLWPGVDIVQTVWRTPATPGHYCIEVELSHPDDANPANNRGWNNTQVHAASSQVRRPIRIFNEHLGPCPPVREGGGPYVRPHRIFAGWGVLGAVTGLFVHHRLPVDDGALALLAGPVLGYLLVGGLGWLLEWAYVWYRRDRRHNVGGTRDDRRTPCHLVEITVDSYEFADDVGKAFDPDAAFAGRPPAWPARVEPDRFVFAQGETHRDVELIVDAPDEPGPPAAFNVNVRQGGAPAGGVTVTVTR